MTGNFIQFVRLIVKPAAPKECLPLNGLRRIRGERVRQPGRRSIYLSAVPAEGCVDGRHENGPLERREAGQQPGVKVEPFPFRVCLEITVPIENVLEYAGVDG